MSLLLVVDQTSHCCLSLSVSGVSVSECAAARKWKIIIELSFLW